MGYRYSLGTVARRAGARSCAAAVASQLWENNPLQNGFVDAERPGDLEQDTSAETQFIEFTEISGYGWWSD